MRKKELLLFFLFFCLLTSLLLIPIINAEEETEEKLATTIVEVFTSAFYNVTQRILYSFVEGVLREDSWIQSLEGILHLFELKAVNVNLSRYESTKLIFFSGKDMSFRHDYGNSGLSAAVGSAGESIKSLNMRERVTIDVKGRILNYQVSATGKGTMRTGAIWYWGNTIEDIVYYREEVSGTFSVTRIVSMGSEVPPSHPSAP
ncbi:MAG TPA: hypothetical protein ENF80_03205 [Thermofilum sp.]|nr:hypothetical protein [Thermofilum sp.]